MKIYGPYKRKDGRWQLTIKTKEGKITSISYPKYLYEQFYQVKLLPHETIDHIDNNPNNNDIKNLQVLSRSDNAKKSAVLAKYIKVICINCNKEFSRRGAIEARRLKQGKQGPYCSKKCVGKVHH